MERACVQPAPRVRRVRVDQVGKDRASIQAAIAMVASRRARRMVLCGLRYAERLLPDAMVAAADVGVRISLDRTPDGPAALIVALADGAATP